MGRRISRDLRPFLEQFERRELLSAITDLIAANSIAAGRRLQSAATNALSSQSIAVPKNQGPVTNPVTGMIENQALAPTGSLSMRQQRKERFTAKYVGTYTVGTGRTSTEATQTFITAAGTANTMLHSDIQLLVITPSVSNTPIGGVVTIFDRNLNSNSALGLDLSAPTTDVDSAGRPDYFPTVSLDTNISAGVYVEGYAVGALKIRYIPSGKRSPGVISQGKAIVTIHAQVYSANTSFILRNSNIDP